jgi:hypothetical protein
MEPVAGADEVNDDELDIDERQDDLEDEELHKQVGNIDSELGDVAGVVGPDGAVSSDADPGL